MLKYFICIFPRKFVVTVFLHCREIEVFIYLQWGSYYRLETCRGSPRAAHRWWCSHFVLQRLPWPLCLLLTSSGIQNEFQIQMFVW